MKYSHKILLLIFYVTLSCLLDKLNSLTINIELKLIKNNQTDPKLSELFKLIRNVNATAITESIDRRLIRIDSISLFNGTIEFSNKIVVENEDEMIKTVVNLVASYLEKQKSTTKSPKSTSYRTTKSTTTAKLQPDDGDYYDSISRAAFFTYETSQGVDSASSDYENTGYASTIWSESETSSSSAEVYSTDYVEMTTPEMTTTTTTTSKTRTKSTIKTPPTKLTTTVKRSNTTLVTLIFNSTQHTLTAKTTNSTSISKNTTSAQSSRRFNTTSSTTTSKTTKLTTTTTTKTTTTTRVIRIKCSTNYGNYCLNAAECYYKTRADLDNDETPLCDCRVEAKYYYMLNVSYVGQRCELVRYSFTYIGFGVSMVLTVLILTLIIILCGICCKSRREPDVNERPVVVEFKKGARNGEEKITTNINQRKCPPSAPEPEKNSSWKLIKNEVYFKKLKPENANNDSPTVRKYIEKQTRSILKSFEGLMNVTNQSAESSDTHSRADSFNIKENFIFVNRCYNKSVPNLYDENAHADDSNLPDYYQYANRLDAKCASNVGVYPKPNRSSNNITFNKRSNEPNDEQTIVNGSLLY